MTIVSKEGVHSAQKIQQGIDFSKWMIKDIRPLLWMVTLGGLLLAALSISTGYLGSLPWIVTLVSLPWTAHGVVCSFYLNLAKSDHSAGGITFEAAKATNFGVGYETVVVEEVLNSPPI